MSTNGETYEIDSGIDTGTAGESGTEPPATEPAPARPSTAVDLAAWARGDREYPFTEVAQAIDTLIFDQLYEQIAARRGIVKDRAAAVDFIVEEGLIEPAEARTDV